MSSNSLEIPNPIYPGDAADPCALRTKTGELFVYTTQTHGEDGMTNMPVLYGENLLSLKPRGDAMPIRPDYAKQVGNIWAPHVTPLTAEWVITHFASGVDSNRGQGHGSGVGISRGLGQPITTFPELLIGGDKPGFDEIDGMVFTDPVTSTPYLTLGSGNKPLRIRELAPDLTQFAPGSFEREIFAAPAELGPGVVEAPWIVYDRYAPRGRQYILYFSFGDCFGEVDSYRLGVAVAGKVTGPYRFIELALRNGTELTNAGHHSFVIEADGSLATGSDDSLLMLLHCIATEVVKEKAHSFMERPLAATTLKKNRLRSGADGVWLGSTLKAVETIDRALVGKNLPQRQVSRKWFPAVAVG